jgi:hypothetical protein
MLQDGNLHLLARVFLKIWISGKTHELRNYLIIIGSNEVCHVNDSLVVMVRRKAHETFFPIGPLWYYSQAL